MRHRKSPAERHLGASLWQRWALNIGAVLGTLCLLMAALTLVFGLKPLVFASGSMGPDIPTGSFGLATPVPVAEVLPGQVVSVTNSEGTRVTHRVMENMTGGLVLKGDANSEADLQPYAVETADRLLFSIPLLGYVISWFNQPWAFFLGGLLCAYLLYLAFGQRDTKGARMDGSHDVSTESGVFSTNGAQPGCRSESGKLPRTLLGIGSVFTALVLVISLGIAAQVQPTQAVFSAKAEASTGPLTSLTLQPVPGTLTCTTTGGVLGIGTKAEFSWNAPTLPPGARYALRLQSSTGESSYIDGPRVTGSITLSGGLNLLGLLTGGRNRTLPVKLFVVMTTDGQPVNTEGTNIGWSTPVASSPEGSVIYHPGVLLVRYFSCP